MRLEPVKISQLYYNPFLSTASLHFKSANEVWNYCFALIVAFTGQLSHQSKEQLCNHSKMQLHNQACRQPQIWKMIATHCLANSVDFANIQETQFHNIDNVQLCFTASLTSIKRFPRHTNSLIFQIAPQK